MESAIWLGQGRRSVRLLEAGEYGCHVGTVDGRSPARQNTFFPGLPGQVMVHDPFTVGLTYDRHTGGVSVLATLPPLNPISSRIKLSMGSAPSVTWTLRPPGCWSGNSDNASVESILGLA
jgi:hypothetical protein